MEAVERQHETFRAPAGADKLVATCRTFLVGKCASHWEREGQHHMVFGLWRDWVTAMRVVISAIVGKPAAEELDKLGLRVQRLLLLETSDAIPVKDLCVPLSNILAGIEGWGKKFRRDGSRAATEADLVRILSNQDMRFEALAATYLRSSTRNSGAPIRQAAMLDMGLSTAVLELAGRRARLRFRRRSHARGVHRQ